MNRRTLHWRWSSLSLALIACHAPEAPLADGRAPDASTVVAAPSAASPEPSVVDAGAATVATAAAVDAGGTAALDNAIAGTQPAPSTDRSVDAAGWVKAHGVRDPNAEDMIRGCTAVRFGVPARDGLFCVGTKGPMSGSYDDGESVFPLFLYYAEGGALRSALTLPVSAGPLDNDFAASEGDPFQGSYVRLDAVLAPDGTSVTIREPPQATCAMARKTYAAPELFKHRKMVERACASIGTYVWRAGHFVRGVAPRPSGTPPTAPSSTERPLDPARALSF